MAKAKSKTDTIISKNMREVFTDPPSTLKPGKTGEARRKQQVAIAMEKSRSEGAKIPKKK